MMSRWKKAHPIFLLGHDRIVQYYYDQGVLIPDNAAKMPGWRSPPNPNMAQTCDSIWQHEVQKINQKGLNLVAPF